METCNLNIILTNILTGFKNVLALQNTETLVLMQLNFQQDCFCSLYDYSSLEHLHFLEVHQRCLLNHSKSLYLRETHQIKHFFQNRKETSLYKVRNEKIPFS